LFAGGGKMAAPGNQQTDPVGAEPPGATLDRTADRGGGPRRGSEGPEPRDMPAAFPGDRLKERFVIEKELGRGSGGVVFLARDEKLGRSVAIKILRQAGDAQALARFVNEAQAVGRLDHPNVLVVHDVGDDRGSPFIVSELLSGRTLRARLQEGPLSADEALTLALQLARGLAATHEERIVHRDLKPANLFLLGDGRLKILDFGVAKLLPPVRHPGTGSASGPRTETGANLGTVPYMSPEQVRGQHADSRSDVFAFGAILHEMLSGSPPFSGPSDVEIGYAIVNEDPPPLPDVIPQPLRAVVRRCLAKRPEDRFQSARELLDVLEKLAAGPLSQPLFTRRRAVVLSAPLAVIAAGFAVQHLWPSPAPVPQPRRLAVLPFHAVGANADGEALSAGLGEILANKLRQIEPLQPSLSVISAADVARERIGSARDARSAFGATLALTGTIQFVGDRIAVTANLVDTGTQTVREARDFEVPRDDIPGIGRLLVQKIGEMLELDAASELQGGPGDAFAASPRAARLYVQGRGYLQRYDRVEDLDRALEAFAGALKTDPDFALAHAGMAEAWLRRDRIIRDPSALDHARTSVRRAVETGGSLTSVVLTAGLVQLAGGEHADAIQSFRRALQIDPANADALRELANAYDAAGQTANAESTFLRAVHLRPDSWAATRALGVFYNRHGRLQDALAQFQRVLAMTPDSYVAYANLGGIYLRLGRHQEAAGALEKSLALRPTSKAYMNLGSVYYFEARYREAGEAYRKAAQLTPSDERAWGAVADALRWVPGNEDEAAGAYRQAIALAQQQAALNPRNAELHSRLAMYHAYAGDRDAADAELQEALRLSAGDGAVLFQAALVHEQLGRRQRALDAVEQALRAGYSREEIGKAPALEALRHDSRYRAIALRSP
jgi:eukaryotic-like serine/threonine-protein kinase